MWKLKLKRSLLALGRQLKVLAMIDLVIAVIAAIVCWFAGWRTFEAYGLSLLASGAIVLVFAGLGAMGSTTFLANPTYMLARSVEAKPLIQRLGEDVDHIREGFDFMVAASGVSLSLLLLGSLVLSLTR